MSLADKKVLLARLWPSAVPLVSVHRKLTLGTKTVGALKVLFSPSISRRKLFLRQRWKKSTVSYETINYFTKSSLWRFTLSPCSTKGAYFSPVDVWYWQGCNLPLESLGKHRFGQKQVLGESPEQGAMPLDKCLSLMHSTSAVARFRLISV